MTAPKPPRRAIRDSLTDHLEPYKYPKGVSGNPTGNRKKDLSIMFHVKNILDELVRDNTKNNKGKTWARLVAEAMVKAATMPQHKAYSTALIEILNRIDGKPIDLSASITINMTPEMIAFAQDRLRTAREKSQALLDIDSKDFLPTQILIAPPKHTQENERLDGSGQKEKLTGVESHSVKSTGV